MILKEVNATEDVVEQLISLSEYWKKKTPVTAIKKNTLDDIKGNRIFLAVEDNIVIGYLLGHKAVAEKAIRICRKRSRCRSRYDHA